MKRRTLWVIGISLTVVAAMAFIVTGCGGGKTPSSAKSGSTIGSGRTGEIVLTVDWGKSRVIPPSAVRVDVTITGDGLVNPIRDSIPRPQNQTVVTKVYPNLPVGFKRVTAEAKDNNNQTVAAGSGTTTLSEGQRTNLEIVMSEITARTVLVRTFRGKRQAPPDFIAFQDGDGPWQRIEPTITPQYALTVHAPDGRYGLAIVFVRPPEPDGTTEVEVNIIHATVNELSQINWVSEEAPPATTVTVSGTVSGLGSGEAALIAIGGAQFSVYPPYNTYSLQIPPGTYDLVAIKGSTQVWPPAANKMLIQRNVSVSGDTTINIDFNSPDAFDPENRNAVINGVLSGELAGGGVEFRSHNGTEIETGRNFEVPPPTIQFPFAGIPTAKQFGNDIHHLYAIAMSNGSRGIECYFKAPIDLSVTLPSPFGNASVRVAATTPYTRFTASWDAYSGAQAYFAQFGGRQMARRRLVSNPQLSRPKKQSRQAIQASSPFWFVGLSAGWLGGQTSYTLPDLSGLSGWNNSWGFPAGGQVPWEVGAVATNRTIQDFVNAELTPVDGLEVRIASKSGTVTISP